MSIHKRKRKNGISYRAVVTGSFGKQVSKAFARKVDAQKWHDAMLHKMRSGEKVDRKGGKTTVSEFGQMWLDGYGRSQLEPASQLKYNNLLKCQINPWLGGVKLSDISMARVEEWKIALSKQDKWAFSTLNDAIAFLKRILNYAVEIEYLESNRIAKAKPFKESPTDFRFMNVDEIQKLTGWLWDNEPGYYLFYMVALNTGLRLGEIAGLKWDCVDLERRQITVRRSYQYSTNSVVEKTKTNKIRCVPVNLALVEVLRSEKLRSNSEFVVPDWENYGRMAARTRRYCKRANVREVTFHDLRHTFASQFMMHGGNLYDLKKILGHTSVVMTERYSHLSPDHLSGATDILDFGVKQKVAEVLEFKPL